MCGNTNGALSYERALPALYRISVSLYCRGRRYSSGFECNSHGRDEQNAFLCRLWSVFEEEKRHPSGEDALWGWKQLDLAESRQSRQEMMPSNDRQQLAESSLNSEPQSVVAVVCLNLSSAHTWAQRSHFTLHQRWRPSSDSKCLRHLWWGVCTD